MPVNGTKAPAVPQTVQLWGAEGDKLLQKNFEFAKSQQNQGSDGSAGQPGATQEGGIQPRNQQEANLKAQGEAALDAFLVIDPSKQSVFLNPDREVKICENDQHSSTVRRCRQTLIGELNKSFGLPSSSSDKPSGINAGSAAFRSSTGGIGG
jgi:hypothetical protein